MSLSLESHRLYFYLNLVVQDFDPFLAWKTWRRKSVLTLEIFVSNWCVKKVHWLWIRRIVIESEFLQYFLNIPKRHFGFKNVTRNLLQHNQAGIKLRSLFKEINMGWFMVDQVIFSHQPDQMSQRSQVSGISPYNQKSSIRLGLDSQKLYL